MLRFCSNSRKENNHERSSHSLWPSKHHCPPRSPTTFPDGFSHGMSPGPSIPESPHNSRMKLPCGEIRATRSTRLIFSPRCRRKKKTLRCCGERRWSLPTIRAMRKRNASRRRAAVSNDVGLVHRDSSYHLSCLKESTPIRYCYRKRRPSEDFS